VTPAGRAMIEKAQPVFSRVLGDVEGGLGSRRDAVVDGFVELQGVLRALSAQENTTKS